LRRLFENLPPAASTQNPLLTPAPAFRSQKISRKLEQVHFCLGTTGPARRDDDRFAFALANNILGGGASSRIFQEVREKRGLAYSIGSFDVLFKDSGCFAISGGTSPRNAAKVVDICLEQVKLMYVQQVSQDELDMAREQLVSGILLSMESSSSRMSRLAETEIYHGHYVPVNEVLDRIRKVTVEDVHNVAEKHLKGRPITFAGIAPGNKFDEYLQEMAF